MKKETRKYELKYLTVCPVKMFNLPGNVVSVYVDGNSTMQQIKDMLILSSPEKEVDQEAYILAVEEFFQNAIILQLADPVEYMKRKFREDLPICSNEEEMNWDIKVFFRLDKFKV